MVYAQYNENNIQSFCQVLADREPVFKTIIDKYSFPPTYSRREGFDILIRNILEQQVSLASAKAAFYKLLEKLENITPEGILSLSAEDLKDCYLSRQKIVYVRALSEGVTSKALIMNDLHTMSDEDVRAKLTAIKGIGNWTADVYLMMSLHRLDLFPTGDIAMMNSMKKQFNLDKKTNASVILEMAEAWKPYRSIATILLWHAYIIERKLVL